MVALCFFSGDPDQYCYETLYFFEFTGGPDPMSPTSGSANANYICKRRKLLPGCLIVKRTFWHHKVLYLPESISLIVLSTQPITKRVRARLLIAVVSAYDKYNVKSDQSVVKSIYRNHTRNFYTSILFHTKNPSSTLSIYTNA